MSSKDLPQVILRDRLERLPAKSLIVFRSVCKLWYSLITDPNFIASHLSRGNFHSKGYLMHMPLCRIYQQMCHVICDRKFTPQFNLAFPLECEFFNVTGSCNGMLCLTNPDIKCFGQIVYLWNPSIRKLKCLPRSPFMTAQFLDVRIWVVLGLGFDHVTGDHKIVRLSYFWDYKEECLGMIPNETEVYTLQTNSWRRIRSTALCRADTSSHAFVSGSIHWIAHKPKGPDYFLILSFDLTNEVFHELMLPPTCYDATGMHTKVLAGFHGSLSLLICNPPTDNWGLSRYCYMWVMKKYGVAESWIKQFTFAVEEGIYKLPGLTTAGEIIYQDYHMENFLCDPVDGRHKNTGPLGFRFDLVALTDSLVLLEEH